MGHQKEIRDCALRLLARREHCASELRRKLRQRRFQPAAIEALLAQLIEEDALSEQRYVENFTRARMMRGFGPQRIRAELREKALCDQLISRYVISNDACWDQQIDRVWRKRFGGHLPENLKERAQQIRYLQYRGYTTEQINRVLDDND